MTMKEIEELVKWQMKDKALQDKELQELRAKLLWFKTHCKCYNRNQEERDCSSCTEVKE